MPNLIHNLSHSEQLTLLEELNYLNMDEIRAFSNKHAIPYKIWIETESGGRRKTKELDRKGVILDRIRHYLKTGEVLDATCFPASVCCPDDLPPRLEPTDRLFFGQYDKQSRAMVGLLENLTNGQFKNGAIARIVAREFWSKGVAPTFEQFARAWLKAKENHNRPNSEWAFLSDKFERKDMSNWKQIRVTKAKWVLSILNAIAPP
jgi:hypothetical protein